jgi:polyhydroxyalkanoate synthesis repressor PhaR
VAQREGLSESPPSSLLAERPALRLIKKYHNRKFYDTVDKRYVSLSGISSLVREGEKVQVVDNLTGNDLTTLVLSQILREQERQDSSLPQGLLMALVRRGSGGLDQLRGSFHASLKALQELEDEIRERTETLASRGEITLTEAQEWREELAAAARERHAADEERVIQEIQHSLLRFDLPTQGELEGLRSQLEQIEAKVDSLLGDQRLSQ